MINLVLYRPQMPANAGNVIRLAANFNIPLHFIGPLDFFLDEKKFLRAGLDYHEIANMTYHTSFTKFMETEKVKRLIAATTHGCINPDKFQFNKESGDYIIFGRETEGLPDEVMSLIDKSCQLRIPMQEKSRCLNLSNSVAVLAYEAMRQFNFENLH